MVQDIQLYGPFPPPVFRSRKLLDLAEGQVCVRCGRNDQGTVVAAHYHGPYQHLFHKAGSQKADDFMSAHLCIHCHMLFDDTPLDKSPWGDEMERALEFMICIARTWQRLIYEKHIQMP